MFPPTLQHHQTPKSQRTPQDLAALSFTLRTVATSNTKNSKRCALFLGSKKGWQQRTVAFAQIAIHAKYSRKCDGLCIIRCNCLQAAADAEAGRLASASRSLEDDRIGYVAFAVGDANQIINQARISAEEAAIRLDDLRDIEDARESPRSDKIEPNSSPQRQGSRKRSFIFKSQSRPSTPLSIRSPVQRQDFPGRVCERVQGREDSQIIAVSADNVQVGVLPVQNRTSPYLQRSGDVSRIASASCGRGRGVRGRLNRGRRGSRGRRTTGRKTSTTKENATYGWKIAAQTSEEITLDDELIERYFTRHTRLFITSAMERMRVELEAKRLQPTRVG